MGSQAAMRVLVIGGTGFVGAHAVTRLCRLGHAVTVAHRGVTEAQLPPEVRHVHHPSITNVSDAFLSGVEDELRALDPEVVLDMIPGGEPDCAALVRVFRGVARRVVGISSIDVYRAYGRLHRREPGPPDPVPLREAAPLREQFFPEGPNIEKILAERVLMGEPELPGTILRWPMVYGPRDPIHRLHGYLQQMDAGRPAILLEAGRARWRASRGFSENVAHAVVLAVTDGRAASRVYNVAEADALTEAQWVREIGRAAGWDGEVMVVPPADAPPHLVQGIDTRQHWVVDTTRIRAELDYAEPVPRAEALRRTVAWQRANPPTAGSRWAVPDDQLRQRFAAEDALVAQPRGSHQARPTPR